jgi:hypothetical protein
MVVDRHGQLFLGGILPDHVLIEIFLDLEGLRDPVRGGGGRFGLVVFED